MNSVHEYYSVAELLNMHGQVVWDTLLHKFCRVDVVTQCVRYADGHTAPRALVNCRFGPA